MKIVLLTLFYHVSSILIILQAGGVDHDRVAIAAAAAATGGVSVSHDTRCLLLCRPWDAALLGDATQRLPARHGLIVAARGVEFHVGGLGASGGATPWKMR